MVSATGTAWANTTITINPGNVPTTAAAFNGGTDCDFGGGPFSNGDVFIFVLPGNHSTSGDFVSLTATFNGGADTITIPGPDGGFANGGPQTSKAFVITPVGWTLTGATAEVTGTLDPDKDHFNLTGTCASTGTTPTPTPTTTSPGGGGSSSSSSSSGGGGSSSTTHGGGSSSSSGSSGGSLPVTGMALTGIIIAGVALVGGGAALLYTRRRMDRSTGTGL